MGMVNIISIKRERVSVAHFEFQDWDMFVHFSPFFIFSNLKHKTFNCFVYYFYI